MTTKRDEVVTLACALALSASAARGNPFAWRSFAATQPATTQPATTQPAADVADEAATQPATAPARRGGFSLASMVGRVAQRSGAKEDAAQSDKPLVAAVKARPFARQPTVLLAALAPATQPATRPATTQAADDPAARAVAFERAVLTGDWPAARAFLAALPADELDPIYAHVLAALAGGAPGGGGDGEVMPQGVGVQRIMMTRAGLPMPVRNAGGGGENAGAAPPLLADEVLHLAALYPAEPTKAHVDALGNLLRSATAQAQAAKAVLDALAAGRGRFGGTDPTDRRRAADLLFAAGLDRFARPFLPPAKDDDAVLLDLHARALHAETDLEAQRATAAETGATDQDVENLRQLYQMYGYPVPANLLEQAGPVARYYAGHAEALRLARRALALPTAPPEARASAGPRVVALLDKVPDADARATVAELMGADLPFAAPLVAELSKPVPAEQARDEATQANELRARGRFADALLAADARSPWADVALRSAAELWLTSAKATLARPSPKAQARGAGGSRYYTLQLPGGGQMRVSSSNLGRRFNNGDAPPVVADAKLLEASPAADARWLARLDATLRPALLRAHASLLVREERPTDALPVVEQLAGSEPEAAGDAATELLAGWAALAQPASGGDDEDMMYYGGNQPAAAGIAMGRLRQERNLRELADLLARLRALPGGGPSLPAVAAAFVAAHSPAEVFRPEDVTLVFGDPRALDARRLAELLAAMRERLAGQWRKPQTQTKAGTKRDDKALAAEIERGYGLVAQLADAAAPHWRVETVAAGALFDWNEYRYGRGVPLAEYTARRDKSFARFALACDLYKAACAAGEVPRHDESAEPFFNWFLAALGASDLAQLTRQQAPQLAQVEQVKAALAALGDGAQRHVDLFAEQLDAQAGTVPPELKDRTLRNGLTVVGAAHPKAAKARDLVRYYDDLLGELRLVALLDAPGTSVGVEPFGLHLGVRHTAAIGRESGGFGRFLQTSNQQRQYSYAPPSASKIDRDKIERSVREALTEKFEIVSLTWHATDVQPRGDPAGEAGWRYTPLAFALLKAKDPSADRVPPVRLDFDFLDAAGPVVLPIESGIVALDALGGPGDAGVAEVALTQTLDEAALREGKLTLDVRASGQGVLPALDRLLDVGGALGGWKVTQTDGGDLTVSGLNLDGDRVRPTTERAWTLTLAPASEDAAAARRFAFPPPRAGVPLAAGGATNQRFAGTELAKVDGPVELDASPIARRGWLRPALVAGGVVAAGVVAGLALRRRRRARSAAPPRYALPRDLTPFTLVTVLRRMERDGAANGDADALRADIRQLEREHFAADAPRGANLAAVAQRWLGPQRT